MSSKFLFSVFVSLSSVLLVKAIPLSTPNIASHLYPRANPCEPGGTPILYHEYLGDLCPPKNTMNSDGSCPTRADQSCQSYCEVRQMFTYDQEKPVVNNPYCHGPLTCTISESKAFTYTYTGTFNLAWTKAFTAGVTGGFNYAEATTQLQSTSVNLKAGECGYFTFLPELHDSCGSISDGELWEDGKCHNIKTTGNVCTQQPARTADGKQVLGATVFVKTDCGNNQRLPMDQQDPAYQHEGVAQPQAVYDSFMKVYSTCKGANGCGVLQPVIGCTDLTKCP